MTLRSMEIYVAVVQNLSMSKAAHALHISQPTISQTVKEAEQEYGVALFNRVGKKLHLTPQGECLYNHIRVILGDVQNMHNSMTNMAENPTILLGATISIGQSLLAQAVQQFEAENSPTRVIVTVENTVEIESLLLNSKLDMAFVEGEIQSKQLVTTPVCQDEMVLVCSLNHPVAHRQSVKLEQIVSSDFLVREEGSGTRELFRKELEKRGETIRIKWTAHSFDAILSAVAAGQGVTVMSRLVAQSHITAARLAAVRIQNLHLTRNFSLVHHKNRILTPQMQLLAGQFAAWAQSNPPAE